MVSIPVGMIAVSGNFRQNLDRLPILLLEWIVRRV